MRELLIVRVAEKRQSAAAVAAANKDDHIDSQSSPEVKHWLAVEFEKPIVVKFDESEVFVRRLDDCKYYAVKRNLTSPINIENIAEYRDQLSSDIYEKACLYLQTNRMPFNEPQNATPNSAAPSLVLKSGDSKNLINNVDRDSNVGQKNRPDQSLPRPKKIFKNDSLSATTLSTDVTTATSSLSSSSSSASSSSSSEEEEADESELGDKFLAQLLSYSEVVNVNSNINDYKLVTADGKAMDEEINLYRLNTAVMRLGGEKKLVKNQIWNELFAELAIPNTPQNTVTIRRLYVELLIPFNKYMRTLGQNFTNIAFSPKLSKVKSKKSRASTNASQRSTVSPSLARKSSKKVASSEIPQTVNVNTSIDGSYKSDRNSSVDEKSMSFKSSDKPEVRDGKSKSKSPMNKSSDQPGDPKTTIESSVDSSSDFLYLLDVKSLMQSSASKFDSKESANRGQESAETFEERNSIVSEKEAVYKRMLQCANLHSSLKQELKMKEKELQGQ